MFQRIAGELSEVEHLLELVEAQDVQARPALKKEFVAPRTPVEQSVADLWAQILGVERVGVHDNFFDLGGHSLLAAQALARVQNSFQVEVSLYTLFEKPTVAELAAKIEAAILSAQPVSTPPIKRVVREDPPLLSFAQQRLWILSQLEPNSAFYNIPAAVRLRGRLDLQVLQGCLREIVRRHESLRTTFSLIDDYPRQIVHEPSSLDLEVTDLSHLPDEERRDAADRLAAEEARRPFDLSNGPLIRVRLLRLDEEEQLLVLVLHHIISDGWSMGVLIREAAALYEAYSRGAASPLPELEIQYADYAAWQRQYLTSEVLDQELNYWKERLTGAPPLLELPTDYARPAMQSYRGRDLSFSLPADLSARLAELSQKHQATLFMTLLAAFQALLYRSTGQTDICVGTPIAGRNHSEIEGLIGFFANTLVLRTDLSGKPDFAELLGRVREVCIGAYAHQSLPFEKLVEELQPERNLSHMPLFQVMFVLQNAPAQEVQLSGLTMSGVEIPSQTAKFDLLLMLEETAEGLKGVIEYNTDLFEQSTIERLIERYGILLELIVADPAKPLCELPLLTDAEREQILNEWNNTERDYPTHLRLHQLIEAQVERSPDSTALISEHRSLSYRQLNAAANRLAHHLRSRGAGPDHLVGILMERSVEMVVSLLGVLKAGAAYLPLDPTYPAERLRFMLSDARPLLVLTQERFLEMLEGGGVEALALDREGEPSGEGREDNPENEAEADNLAYVIYTSGSTGQPKAAMNTHAGICNRLLWMQEAYELDGTDCVVQKTPYTFDVSVWEFFWPLMTGARLVMARPGGHQDSGYLARLIAEQGVTTIHFVPSMLQLFLEEQGLERVECLRRVICSGEALSLALQQRYFERMKAALYNLYGPTEAAVDATHWQCEAGGQRRSVPIGRPIGNMQAYVLDERQQMVQVGVTGELYLAGVGLARGYMGRAGLTAERFVANPYSRVGGERMYRTGDVARYLAGGEIEYVGRIDNQVKVRGFRIELGEIEAALLADERVREAVVMAREGEQGEGKSLVAYVVKEEGAELTVGGMQEHLRKRLPEYMVASRLVVLEEMPLSANGKVDRRRLPEPERSRPELDRAYIAPRTPLEQWLADMLKTILGLEQVGVEDNFFELGGDSIKGAVFINRLQEALGQYIYVVAIFDAPTIARLAVYLKENYPEAVGRLFCEETETGVEAPCQGIDAAKVRTLREAITPLAPANASSDQDGAQKNPPAIFILSPPRSGSTLLRVMAAGHPQLFAPPELELLSFNTLTERRETFTGRNSFSLEGTLRALMELKQCDAAEAKRIMQQYEDGGMTTRQFYRLLQEWIGERRLVDKTPSYALDREVLRRAESDFDQARYIHLVRHPAGMMTSFEEARLDQVFFRYPHDFSRRQLAELIWVISQENILDFLEEVSAERQHRLHFEELLREPRRVMEQLCEFLNLEFTEAMIEPYRNKERRMTDGIHPESKMHGDMKFHEHQGIDASTAERWKRSGLIGELGEITWQLAERLGYERTALAGGEKGEPRKEDDFENGGREGLGRRGSSHASHVVEIQGGDGKQPFFCVHPLGGNVLCYFDLARHLGSDQPFYGLQALGLNGEEVQAEMGVEAIAAQYVEALRSVQPRGPYALGGWSMGGVVAYEMAQQLRAQDEQVARLVLLDAWAPAGRRGPMPNAEPRFLARFAFNLGLSLKQLTVPLDQIGQLEPDEQLTYVMKLAQSSEIIPPNMTLTYFRRLFEVFKTNVIAVRGYAPQVYQGRITLFRASETFKRQNGNSGWGQTLLRRSGLGRNGARLPPEARDGANGWSALASEGVDVRDVPGDHYTMLRKPHVEVLAEQLKDCLSDVQVAQTVI